MKIKYIVPCVCIDHKPDVTDSSTYGMPNVAVGQGGWFSCYCPKCGRGSEFLDWRSTFNALRYWNDMQLSLWWMRREDEKEEWIEEVYAEISREIMRR